MNELALFAGAGSDGDKNNSNPKGKTMKKIIDSFKADDKGTEREILGAD